MSPRLRPLGLVVAAMVLATGLLVVRPAGSGATAPAAPSGGAVSGIVLVNPLHVEMSVPRRNVRAGQRVQVSATIRNLGTQPIRDVVARLHASHALVIIPDEERELGIIGAGSQVRASWQVCSDHPVSQLLLVSADAMVDTTPIHAVSGAQLLSVTSAGRGGPTCP